MPGLRTYSVRKMGTRRGQPHYGADCLLCAPARVLVVAHLDRDQAKGVAVHHIRTVHGRNVG